ncbi:MAG: hypothetical protein ACKVXR_11005 [Planctomycetota bacterium]
MKLLAGSACAALLIFLIALPGIGPSNGANPWGPNPRPAQPLATTLEIAETEARAATGSAPEASDEEDPGDRQLDLDLVSRLRAVARAHAQSDVETLEANLEALLRDPRDAWVVLERLGHGGLADDSAALQGAVITILAGVSLYNQPGWNGPPGCREFLGRVLDALPDVPMPWLEQLVTGLVEARAGERPIIGFALLPKILALRAEHPDLAPVISLLLEHVADELKETGGYEELYSLLLGETRDPTAVAISLSALLASQPEAFLQVAEEMHSRAREDPELASAITQAIAASAPVDQAAGALARLTDGTQYLEFLTLGTREGALESLSSEYNALVAQGDHPQARAMLVAGMGAEEEEALLGIAATDLDSRVRAQALLTGSLGRAVGPHFVQALREAHAGRGNELIGIDPNASVAIAENVLRASPGQPREAARKLLLEIAGDEAISDTARWRAAAAVKPWVPAGTLRGLFIGGKAVE